MAPRPLSPPVHIMNPRRNYERFEQIIKTFLAKAQDGSLPWTFECPLQFQPTTFVARLREALNYASKELGLSSEFSPYELHKFWKENCIRFQDRLITIGSLKKPSAILETKSQVTQKPLINIQSQEALEALETLSITDSIPESILVSCSENLVKNLKDRISHNQLSPSTFLVC